jgi:hypothetical protein
MPTRSGPTTHPPSDAVPARLTHHAVAEGALAQNERAVLLAVDGDGRRAPRKVASGAVGCGVGCGLDMTQEVAQLGASAVVNLHHRTRASSVATRVAVAVHERRVPGVKLTLRHAVEVSRAGHAGGRAARCRGYIVLTPEVAVQS